MKYIDADKLIAEIERRLKIVEPHKDTFESAAACRQELIWMKEFITSLQQEHTDADLWKEIHRYFNPHGMELQYDRSRGTTILKPEQLFDFARHFWNKGYNARKK